MLTMQTLHEPMVADEVLTPASLPPSATNLTTRGRSLFNDVLSAIRMRQHRACSNNSADGSSMDYRSEVTAPPRHMQSSSQSTWNHFSSERPRCPTQLCPSQIQVLSTPTPASARHSVCGHTTSTLPVQSSDIITVNWRCDQNEVLRDSDDSRLAKTRDHIQSTSGSYASRHQQSAIGRQDDVIHGDVGVQAKGSRYVIQSETVARGQDCGQKSAVSVTNAPSSSSHYRHRGTTEKAHHHMVGHKSGLNRAGYHHQAKPKSEPNLKNLKSRQSKLKVMSQGAVHIEKPLQAKSESRGLLKDVRKMSTPQLEEIKSHLTQPHLEVACTLVYADHSTQLRNRKDVGKDVEATEIAGVALAYPVSGAKGKPSTLHFIHIPLCYQETLQAWSKSILLSIMSTARVISYRGQELAAALISHYFLVHEHEWLRWSVMDTSVAAWLLNPDHPAPRTFTDLLQAFNLQTQSKQDASAVDSEISICRDLSMLGPLMTRQYNKMMDENLWTLYEEIEVKLIPILAAMEVAGIQINTAKLLKYTDLLKTRLSRVEQNVYKAAGHPFLIHSTSQLRQVLFEELQLDKQCSKKLSRTHIHQQKSTSESVLQQLKDLHPLPRLILEYRQISKVNATYVTGVLPFIKEGTLKPHWQQTVAATGRLTSSMPNIQAFPKEPIQLGPVQEQYIIGKAPKEISVDIRETVESQSGFTYLAADFKSIELRLVAHLSEDPRLLSMLNSKENLTDIFTLLASEWLGMSIDSVTHVERERTKRVVYAVIYGVGKERLAEILNVDVTIAKELRSSFLEILNFVCTEKFSNVQEFITNTISEARDKGCLSTICNRKRWFPNLNSANSQLKSHAERQAVNFPVQGSAADLCKKGMIQVMKMLAQESPKTKLLMQIHDELIFEVPDEQIQEVAGKVKSVLESLSTSCQLKIPLEVRISTGKNWAGLLAMTIA